jgi:hypothetical protein
MRRRKQEGASFRAIHDAEEKRRVCLVRNLDGTFGFLEWTFSEVDDSWLMTQVGAGSRLKTVEEAMNDAKGRVEWLSKVF